MRANQVQHRRGGTNQRAAPPELNLFRSNLKRLRESKMHVFALELVDRVGSVYLRDQESRRVEQVAVVDGELAADRGL